MGRTLEQLKAGLTPERREWVEARTAELVQEVEAQKAGRGKAELVKARLKPLGRLRN